jgi:hypothetical protein
MTPDQAKQVFKILIGWFEIVKGKKQKIKVTKETHNLNKKDFSDLIRLCEDWWVDWYNEPLPHRWQGEKE